MEKLVSSAPQSTESLALAGIQSHNPVIIRSTLYALLKKPLFALPGPEITSAHLR